MTRKSEPTPAEPPPAERTQAEPTAPRPVTENGRVLDGWGLPLSGPARAAALAELRKPDPLADPAAWATSPATEN